MKLETLLGVLRGVAPEHLAEDWDEVGLHLAGSGKGVRRALLCIDLTPAVLDEAIHTKCQLIVAYHPPIFRPLKRLADRDWKERMISLAIRRGIAVYSPHTALDSVRDGMNDWLCDGLGAHAVRWSIGVPKRAPTNRFKIVVYVPRDEANRMREIMARAGAGSLGNYVDCSFSIDGVGLFRGNENSEPAIGTPGCLERVEETRIEAICFNNSVGDVIRAVRDAHPYEEPAIDVFELAQEPLPEDGEQTPGRVHHLKKPVPVSTLIARVKRVLGIKKLKVARPSFGDRIEKSEKSEKIESIAVCVGAGGSLFEKYPHCDAYITGEMQHHQVLDLVQKGKTVILAGHSNTERPFLKNYREALIKQGAGRVEWLLSETDTAPIEIA